jgi:predicted RNA binding protein YcfA (HicA-like mRNA interferase family)
MSVWGSAKAKKVLQALFDIGRSIQRESPGSHQILQRDGWSDTVFAFHDGTEIGPKMLARIAKHTGLRPSDL